MIVKADGPTILRIGFEPAAFAKLRTDEKEHVIYHLLRLLEGKGSAVMEWEHLSIKIDAVPWKDQRR